MKTQDVSVSDGVDIPAKCYDTSAVNEDTEKILSRALENNEKNKDTAAASVMIPVGRMPAAIAMDGELGRVFVTSSCSNMLNIVDTGSNKVLSKLSMDGMPKGIAIDSFSGRIYVVNSGGQTINIYDGRTGIELEDDILTGENNPGWIAVDSRRHMYYVSHGNMPYGTVVAMDATTNRPVATAQVGAGTAGLAVNELTGRIYVANTIDGTVSVIDGSTFNVISTIPVQMGPSFIVVNENTNRFYVSCSVCGTVKVIDGSSNVRIAAFNVGEKPQGMALDTGRDRLYVANMLSDSVSVVNTVTNTVIDEIKVGRKPTGVVVDSKQNKLFVILEDDDNIEVLNLAESRL